MVPPPEPPLLPPDPDPADATRGRKILWALFALTAVVPPVWAIGFFTTILVLSMVPWSWPLPGNLLVLLVPSLISLLVAWRLLRSGLRRDPPGRGRLAGWGIAAAVMAGLVAVAAVAVTHVRDSSRLKAMIPRQPAAAIDQYYLEFPNRIFLQYDELVGPDRYVKGYNPVDGEDLRVQFPIRQGWSEPLSVRLPDGTTVRRLEVLAAIGRSGLIATYPRPQDDQYSPKLVYRLDCGISFRGSRVVDLPPDPAGREGRDQDGVHTYLFPDGRRYEITYRGGVPDGPFHAFYADGAPWGQATYRNGRVVEAWLIARDGRKFDELKDGEAAEKAVRDSLIVASQGARDSGLQKLRAKDYAGAIIDLTRALTINLHDRELYRARGDAHRATGKFDEAIDDYGAAEGFAPTSLGDYRMPSPLHTLVLERGRRRQQAGDTAGAARDFAAIGRDVGWATEEMLQNRDFAGAVRMLDTALEVAPIAELYAARADARRTLPGQEQAAATDYTQALALARQGQMQIPANQRVLPAHWLYKRGHVRRWQGNFTGAAEDFRAALPPLGTGNIINQSDAACWLFLAQCEAGRRDEAGRELQAMDRTGWWPAGQQTARFLLGEITEAELDAAVVKSNQDGDRLKVELLSGLLRRLNGDETGALDRLRQAARRSNHDAIEIDAARREAGQTLRTIAGRAMASGDFATAAAMLKDAVSFQRPAPAGLLALYGDARRGAKDLEGAFATYQESLRAVVPGTEDALGAELREKIAALNAELQPIRQARAAQPKPPGPAASQFVALRNSGTAKLARRDPTGALADFTRALELQPKSADLYRLRGDARRQLGELDQALADYSEAMRQAPSVWGHPYRRGQLHRMKSDLALAAQDFRSADALFGKDSPQYPADVAFWLYFTECELGRTESAAAELARISAQIQQTGPGTGGTPGVAELDRSLFDLLLGRDTEAQVMAAVDRIPRELRETARFRALFLCAMARRAAGDLPGALERFRQALALSRVQAQTYEFEIAEAKRLLAAAEAAGK